MRILIVDDAARLRGVLEQALRRLGHAVDAAADGLSGEAMARESDYDVIVLDRMLPGKDGLTVLRDLRRSGVGTPVLLLTALADVDERVRGLGAGADDYLTKPFAIPELAARLEALSRRRSGLTTSTVVVGPVAIDLAARRVTRDGTPVELTARELALLECLVRARGRVLSREQIESKLYGDADGPQSNAVDVTIHALRRKLCPPGTAPLIHTRRGLGYVLDEVAGE